MQTLAADYRARRQRLAALHPQALVLSSGVPPTRGDFRADSHFLYFGGWNHPGLTLELEGGEATLYYQPPTAEECIWEGPGPDLDELKERFGFDRILAGSPPAAVGIPDAVIELRLSHDEAAQRQLRQAADMTARAHFQAMRATRPERREFQILATLLVSVTQEGGRTSFSPIVSTQGQILHNPHRDGTLIQGELLLVDFGAETAEGWAGDVTRTYPIRTNFSLRQREIYEVVLAAQKAALQACLPGREYRQVHHTACVTMTQGLVDLGLMRGDPQELVERGAHALFFPHGTGHLLGLDVHDMEDLGDRAGYAPGRARSPQFGLHALRLDRPLAESMAVTVEPGFYWIPQLLEDPQRRAPFADCIDFSVVEAYREVRGIRIEDEVLVTPQGPEVLTRGLPKEPLELEIVVNS